ncbi:MAG: phosphatidylinositol kinase [Cytophagaceae bacterium]|nr:MAG: phosphatidylinositol kinase [Cytophagaceae bacterium]
MSRKADVWIGQVKAGCIAETDEGYVFSYDPSYLIEPSARPVSLTLPLQSQPYVSTGLFPFFDGLIPEGWLLEIAEQNWKLRSTDRFGLLLACCRDCIGNVSIIVSTA